jgi:Radical SAM superfamily/Iron-sulfur cluster-binding domain
MSTRGTTVSIDAGRPLLLGGTGPVIVSLPAAPPNAGPLVVVLMSGSSVEVARWQFNFARSNAAGHLVLSSKYLDQAFVLLDQAGAVPAASAFHAATFFPTADPLQLLVGWAASGTPPDRYSLRWPSNEDRQRLLDEWIRQQVHPAEWFYVEITTSCNLKCPFCPSKDLERSRSHMTLDTARTVFGRIGAYVGERDAAANGYAQINRMVFLHVMGEPLLHPKFVEISRIAHKAGLVPALLTNVTLLDERNIKRLLDADLGHVTLSLNTATAEDFATLGGRDSQIHQERRVMQFLRARSARPGPVPHVDIQYMYKQNAAVAGPRLLGSKEEVWDLYKRWLYLMREAEPPLFRSVDVRPHIDLQRLSAPYAGFGEDPSARFALQPGIDLTIKTACTFGNVALAPGYVAHPTEFGQCPYHNPFRQLAVFVDGSVSFCNLDHENSVNFGSLIDTPLQDLWAGARMQRIRERMLSGYLTEPLCQRCMGSLEYVGAESAGNLREPVQLTKSSPGAAALAGD